MCPDVCTVADLQISPCRQLFFCSFQVKANRDFNIKITAKSWEAQDPDFKVISVGLLCSIHMKGMLDAFFINHKERKHRPVHEEP